MGQAPKRHQQGGTRRSHEERASPEGSSARVREESHRASHVGADRRERSCLPGLRGTPGRVTSFIKVDHKWQFGLLKYMQAIHQFFYIIITLTFKYRVTK